MRRSRDPPGGRLLPGMCRQTILSMIPEGLPHNFVPKQRVVQLPSLEGGCEFRPVQTKPKRQQEQQIDPSRCATPPPNEEIPGTSAQIESENLKKAKVVVITRSKKLASTGHSYRAVNVKEINNYSETLARLTNKKEGERLGEKIKCLDKEKSVLINSITRDEKILLQRSKALATKMLSISGDHKKGPRPSRPKLGSSVSRTRLHNFSSSEPRGVKLDKPLTAPHEEDVLLPNKKCPEAPAKNHLRRSNTTLSNLGPKSAPARPLLFNKSLSQQNKRSASSKVLRRSVSSPNPPKLYGEDFTRFSFTPLKRSRTININKIRTISASTTDLDGKTVISTTDTTTGTAKLLWASSIEDIMKRDLPKWHKTFKDGWEKDKTIKSMTNISPTSLLSVTPIMPKLVPKEAMERDTVVHSSSLSKLVSNKDVDKGAWITNYINTSCAEHFPMI